MTPLSTQQIFDEAVRLHGRGDFPRAESLYRQVLQSNPDHSDAMHGLGVIAGQSARPAEALEWIGRAIAVNPDVADYYYNLGTILFGLGKDGAAIDAFEKSIHLRPDYADAWCSLATARRRGEDYDGAIAAVQSALKFQPNLVKAHNNLASYYRALARTDDSLACYDRALAIDPAQAAIASNRLYLLSFHPGFGAEAILAQCRAWNDHFVRPHCGTLQPHPNDRSPQRPLRIGFVSPDFKSHCQSFFTLPFFTHHDRNQFQFYCYADVPQPDAVSERIRAATDVWQSAVGMTDEALAELIRGDRIDILVDLAMHMAGGRRLLFARKPAPIQIAWLAYPGTTGLSSIDYRLTDPYLDPPGDFDADYSERSIRLQDTFWCYDPGGDQPAPNPLPAFNRGYVTFGCLNNFAKVSPATLRLWSQVLRQIPDSRLILLCPPGEHRRHVLETLAVGASRVRFLPKQPRQDYLKTYHEIDLALDTLPYNGHTTSLDAFWMGVPVITLVGQTVVGRAGWSQLNNLGLTELAAFQETDFVRIAAELSGDLPRLAELRGGLRRRMEHSPLMDAPRFTRGMETVFRELWRDFCKTPGSA